MKNNFGMGYGYAILATPEEAENLLAKSKQNPTGIKFRLESSKAFVTLEFSEYREQEFRQQGKHFDDIDKKLEPKKKTKAKKEPKLDKPPTSQHL